MDIKYINDWYRKFYDNKTFSVGIMNTRGNDMQNHHYIRITTENNFNHTSSITLDNLIQTCVYFAVRKCIAASWLNDRDQFLYPNKKWEKDIEFQNDCLAYAILTNNISSKHGKNHWIPFKEEEMNAQTKYESHIMITFLSGKIVPNGYTDLFSDSEDEKYNELLGNLREKLKILAQKIEPKVYEYEFLKE